MSRFIGLILLVMLLLPICGQADEFSGNQLKYGWNLSGTENVGANVVGGILGLTVPRNGQAFLLREAKAGDWELDTQFLDCVGRRDDYFHGIVIYGDDQHYLVFGKQQDGIAVRLWKNSTWQDIFTCNDAPLIRVQKVTRGADYATYFFYTSDNLSSVYNWIYQGSYADTQNHLAQAQYGLYGSSSKKSAASYDYFTENVLDYTQSVFPSQPNPDGIWTVSESVDVQSTGSGLQVQYMTDDAVIAIHRNPIDKDWRIQTCVSASQRKHGLMVYMDQKNWLLLTPTQAYVSNKGILESLAGIFVGDSWLRMTKVGNIYTMDSSKDGMTWITCAVYQDQSNSLQTAKYGVGGWKCLNVVSKYDSILEMRAPNGTLWDVTEYRHIGRVIGSEADDALNNTYSMAGLRSGDEGNLMEADGRVYMMLGDSFSGDGTNSGNWRSNVLSVIEDDTPEDGLDIVRIISDNKGQMRELITARHKDFDEVTCIPNNGIYVDGTMYYQYMSVYHWGIPAHWDCNYAGWAWSEDGGETWQRMENFFDASSNFVMCALLKQEGYVYLFGIPSAKFGSVQLARVPEQEILNRDAYTFFAGMDTTGMPCWSADENDAVNIVEDQVSELSVVYNPGLDCYLMAYSNEHTVNMVIRDAKSPWGNWSNPLVLTEHRAIGFRYGPFMLERYIRENGQRLYFMATNNDKYAVTWNSVRLIQR